MRQKGWVYPAAGRGKDFASELDDMMISGQTVVPRPVIRFELQGYEKANTGAMRKTREKESVV